MSAADLLAALDRASSDQERQELLARAPPDVLTALQGALVYRRLNADVAAEIAAFDSFSYQLDSAPDDNARLAAIEAARRDPQRGPGWLGEWHWRRGASVQAWLERYHATLTCDVSHR